MSSYSKGARGEREVIDELEERGFACLRAPSSGSSTDRELPDVLAGNGDDFYAIEVKRGGGERVYLDEHEIEDLKYFADRFGAQPLIGVRFDYGEWFFLWIDDLHETPEGNYRVDRHLSEEMKGLDML